MTDGLPPAFAQVLTNGDLLHAIFSSGPRAWWMSGRRGQQDSARWATVCRAFHEPAIRVLWRWVSLLSLWSLLAPPNAPFPKAECDLLAYLQKINSAQLYLDPTRWDRFLLHVVHVRGLLHATGMHASQETDDATGRLIEAVSKRNGGDAVLPLLHTIEWRPSPRLRPNQNGALIPFLTSTLRHATLEFCAADEAEIVLLIRRMRESSPFLEDIVISTTSGLNMGLFLTQELVCFARLRQIQVSQIQGPESFRVLVTKPNLTHLNILQATGSWVGLGQAISVRGLRELSVMGDVSVLSGLFNRISFRALKSAKVGVLSRGRPTPTTVADITTLLALFHNAVSSSGLLSFNFGLYTRMRGSHDVDGLLLRDLLAPILPIHSLRSFSLRAMSTFSGIEDADIEALASAWPGLEHLLFYRGFTTEASVSINAIHHLYKHCTQLQELVIPRLRWPLIGVHSVPAPVDRLPSHPLRQLSMDIQVVTKRSLPLLGADLSDEGAEAMAKYLLDLFPSLDHRQYTPAPTRDQRLGTFLPTDKHFDGRWNKVTEYIYSIRSAHDGL